MKINLPSDSPLAFLSSTPSDSRASARGAALVLDLHMSLTPRNTTPNRIHGVALRVVAQEATLGGKASVTYPALNVGPGEGLPMRIDMQLLRPSQVAGGPLVQVDLDGVLFDNLAFFGPDRLNSRRTLTACDLASAARPRVLQAHSGAGRHGCAQTRDAGQPDAPERRRTAHGGGEPRPPGGT